MAQANAGLEFPAAAPPIRRLPALTVVLAVLLMGLAALMPQTSLISGGIFETWLPGSATGGSEPVHVVLQDQTGLVRLMTPVGDGPASTVAKGTTLIVTWGGGCGDKLTSLTFSQDTSGYLVRQSTQASGCSLLILITHRVALHLWAPIDPAHVRFEGRGFDLTGP
jgi:hypothetical protein